MEQVTFILNTPLGDITDWAIKVGYIALFVIIFSETGPMLVFFLPGDSLLDIWMLAPFFILAASSGNTAGKG